MRATQSVKSHALTLIPAAMVVAAIAALAGVAHASVMETFDGAGWSDGTVVDGTNGWEHHSGTVTGEVVASDGAGYLGTRGVSISSGFGRLERHRKTLGQTVSSGTFVVKALVNMDAGSQAFTGIGADNGASWFAPGTIDLGLGDGVTVSGGDTNVQLRLFNTAGDPFSEVQIGLTLGGLGWIEAQLRIDLDNDTASAWWRDADDNAPGYIGPWNKIGDYGESVDFDITRVTFFVGDNRNDGSGRVDNIGIVVPEPATLALLALGGLTVLLRRRRA